MKKIKCVIMDWAGTAVDYGCFAPVAAFIEAFAEKGLIIDVVQTRKPMGLPKIQHIRELLSMPEVNEQFATRYQRAWTRRRPFIFPAHGYETVSFPDNGGNCNSWQENFGLFPRRQALTRPQEHRNYQKCRL